MNILLSIKPEWAALIYSGKKTIEFRTGTPHKYLLCEDKIFIYETSPVRAVTGYIVVDSYINVHKVLTAPYYIAEKKKEIIKGGCMTFDQIKNFVPGKKLFGWHIVKTFSFPHMDITRFSPSEKPPQSWCYTKADITECGAMRNDHEATPKTYEIQGKIFEYWAKGV